MALYLVALFAPVIFTMPQGGVPPAVQKEWMHVLLAAMQQPVSAIPVLAFYAGSLATALAGCVGLFSLRRWGLWVLGANLLITVGSGFMIPWTYAGSLEDFLRTVALVLLGVILNEGWRQARR